MIILRPGQKKFINHCMYALSETDNTLGIAPTGYGKTIMVAEIIKRLMRPGKRCLFLQHTITLVEQNFQKVGDYIQPYTTSLCFGSMKDYSGDVIFSTTQTSAKPSTLKRYPKFDFLIIDEAHHSTTKSNLAIINHVRAVNPAVKVFGVTATPNRRDKKGLSLVYSNVSGYVSFRKAREEKVIVDPKIMTLKTEADEQLQEIILKAKGNASLEMKEGGKVLDMQSITNHVVSKWKEKASNRKTIVFCSNVAHAQHVADYFCLAGVKAQYIEGKTKKELQVEIREKFSRGEIQVLTNVFLLTEGFDDPSIDCVILLRANSCHGTYTQIIGRGLRTSPGKEDCLVMDFGLSTTIHKSLDQIVDLEAYEKIFDPNEVLDEDEETLITQEEKKKKKNDNVLRRTELVPFDIFQQSSHLTWVNVDQGINIACLKAKKDDNGDWVNRYLMYRDSIGLIYIQKVQNTILKHEIIDPDRETMYKEAYADQRGASPKQVEALRRWVDASKMTMQEANLHAFYHFNYKKAFVR